MFRAAGAVPLFNLFSPLPRAGGIPMHFAPLGPLQAEGLKALGRQCIWSQRRASLVNLVKQIGKLRQRSSMSHPRPWAESVSGPGLAWDSLPTSLLPSSLQLWPELAGNAGVPTPSSEASVIEPRFSKREEGRGRLDRCSSHWGCLGMHPDTEKILAAFPGQIPEALGPGPFPAPPMTWPSWAPGLR